MTTEYLPRSAWATKDMPVTTRQLTGEKLIGLSVHYPGSGNEQLNNLTKEQVISRLRGWWDYHVNVRGWSDIGYQVAVDGSGRVWDLRGITREPSATASKLNPDANEEWGACLFIVGDNEVPTAKAREAFTDFYKTKWLKQWPNAREIRGHGDVPGASTDCPGLWLRTAIRANSLLITEGPNEMLPTDIVGTDKDGTPMTLGELAQRLGGWVYGEFIDGDGTPSIQTRLSILESKVDQILEKLSPPTLAVKSAASKK